MIFRTSRVSDYADYRVTEKKQDFVTGFRGRSETVRCSVGKV